jgi:ABC-type spermidine/putrescine transport system permease subunit II
VAGAAFVVRSVWVSVRNLDPRSSARRQSRRRRAVSPRTLPLLRQAFAALLFAVIVSVNEFVVSLFVSTRVTEILPVAMSPQ